MSNSQVRGEGPDERFAAVGGLSRFNYNPATGQVVHGPTSATFVCTERALTLMNPELVPPAYLDTLAAGAAEVVRQAAERDPSLRYSWLNRAGQPTG